MNSSTYPLVFHNIEPKIEALLALGQQTPIIIDAKEASYVVKFERREKGRTWREWLSALACLLLFRIKVKPKLLYSGNISHEAQRLRTLKALGLPVPTLYLVRPEYIVMEYCGESVAHILNKQRSIDTKLLYAIMDDLITLHNAGQWHGSAQVRNMTIKKGQLYRIDFEENTGAALPLALAQAYDVLQCFNSLSRYIEHNKKEGAALLSYYLRATNNPQVKLILKRVLSYLKKIRKFSSILSKKRKSSKNLRRLLYITNVLEKSLNTHLSTLHS